MKNKISLLLAATTLAFALLSFLQWQKLARQDVRIVALTQENEAKSQQLEELQASKERSDQQRQVWQNLADRASQQARVQPPPRSASPPQLDGQAGKRPNEGKQPEAAAFGKFLSQVMEDPEAKKLIRDQQRLMLDQLYGPLVKQLGLTPEQTEQFKDLLAENAVKNAERASSLLGGEGATNKTEAIAAITAGQKASEDKVKEFLGEERYAVYQEFQQTAGERTQLNLFKQQTAGSEHPLTDDQTERLLALIKEEKLAMAAAGEPLVEPAEGGAHVQAILSEEGSDALLQAQETLGQRVFDRAREVLAPEQLADFARFQTNQLQMMRMGMTMARKLMAPAKAEGDPGPQP